LKPKLLIGRRSRCDITLRFPNVSSHHCELELVNGYWYIRDMGSRNGIKVNDVRCDSKWLMPGDVLSVAKHRYEISYTPTSDGPPPDTEEAPFSRGLLEKAGRSRSGPDEPRPPKRPQNTTEIKPSQKFSDDEHDAVEWLTGDDGDDD
jgi:adenylate cyclase